MGGEPEGFVVRSATEDDVEACAGLLVQVPGSFVEISGDDAAAARLARAAFRSPGSVFSHNLSTVAVLGGRVVGIVVTATADEWRRRRIRTALAMLAAVGVRSGWRLIRRGPREEGLMPPIAAGAVYVVAMAVESTHRRKGIGALLIGHVIEQARGLGLPALVLDVRRDNVDAVRLYEHQGFVTLSDHHRPAGRGLPAATSLRMELKLPSR